MNKKLEGGNIPLLFLGTKIKNHYTFRDEKLI